LAIHWNEYSPIDLRSYTRDIYDFLGKYYDIFPLRSQGFYKYMTKYDILFAYKKIEGIDQVMKGMSRRASFESGMETAAEELEAHHTEYGKEFLAFFPELRAHVAEQAMK
jgi:acyl carrier protein phosphodiesterase